MAHADSLAAPRRPLPARFAERKRWLGPVVTLLVAQCLWAMSATGCGGSGAELGCAPLPACGGSPVGTWQLKSFCQYVPPLNYSVPVLPPPENQLTQKPTPVVAPKSPGDDCSALVYEPNVLPLHNGPIKTVALPHGTGNVTTVPLVISSNHEYSVAVQTLSNTSTHFTPACLTAYGANPTCAELGTSLTAYYTGMPNFSETFTCTNASDGGCDCSYTYEGTAADTGTWQVEGDIMYFFSEGEDLVQPALETTFCVGPGGSSLSISGRDGQSLFNVQGLRYFTLVPMAM